ncbi:heavy metal translocating P-type ATPase [Umezakia ovalisporum]|jgi:Cd2+/Zn2+-exporting ATPase|uniref:Heavy metal translocating P-type ATPase n=1 Tax=Umezakia ovalisporum FSS-43 TaxID=2740520 RepID=A0ABT6K4W3_9CYAN|nr:heavy metal translocating P-type ATPase [Umezakia ovalisporum]MBI1242505.1 heavy metal translocating P-type ATPase [Nostoc sp. RI_552]MDH6057419.1 heavy metal translocating P-type ATPase [Umezakia ovalisporum FSS-43]MDH6065931.1 heavy metal translocating P-type ATPase [Umezakia ovalisporum APH033B]MDH6070809.1 heavy metal translocating P-type ATPase [Umezakia ovalisporum CobakiLakeA]MDH6074927.1 heavy metal translocating P-type ATPase [Umezakia ovalisporum CS-1034]
MLYSQALRRFTQEHSDTLAALFCGLLLFLGWCALHIGWLGWALLLLPAAYVIGGYDSACKGLTTLIREKELDVDLLMIVAALGAASLGLWRREYYLIIDGAILILIFAISGALEGYAMGRTERSIRALMSLTLDTARVLVDGQEKMLSITHLKVGDEIIVKPGELIPTDGIIISGYSTLNQAAITGESLPVEKSVGAEVFAGTLNGYGALKLQVHKPASSSLIQRVIRLVEQAQTEAPPSQQFIERFERIYARVIVVVGTLLVFLPPLLWNWSWEITIYRALTFLVVASPCALMAAIMPTLLSGIANGARQGILFKNGAQLEKIGKVRAIAFDKTGTLTRGNLQVSQVIVSSEHSETDVLKAAAALESCSEHPIGKAIVEAAAADWVRGVDVQAIPGQGIMGFVNYEKVFVGNAAFIQQYVNFFPEELQKSAQIPANEGKTIVWVAQNKQVMGAIAIADIVRTEAAAMITQLRKLGIEQIVMITGDNQPTAESIAKAVGIDLVYAELLPEDKLDVIRQLQQQYKTVAMVGDGINDAPALAQASVGIAMGIAGSDVALENADIVLMADNLDKLATAIKLGRRSHSVVKQNIVVALGFIMLLLIGNFLGNINLPIGVIGHEGSTVLVTLSGLRLLKN